MGEEVKIVLRTEAKGDGARVTKEGLDAVTNSGQRAAAATSKAGRPQGHLATPPPDLNAKLPEPEKQTKAEAARRNRAVIADAEADLANARATGAAPTVIAQRERELRERKLAARFMREQNIPEEEALGKASSLVDSQIASKKRNDEEKIAAKTRIDAEKKATGEMQEQERISKRLTMRLGSAALSAGVVGLEQLLNYQSEMQGVGLRDTAGRSITQRQMGIMGGWRGTSSEAQAKQFAAEDRIYERQQNRPNLENTVKRGTLDASLTGAAGGAALGSLILPGLGTLIGAALGGAAGYAKGRMSGNVTLADDKAAQARDEAERDAANALGQKKFHDEEGGLELDAVRQRSKRTMAGIRAAQVDDLARSGMAEFRRLKSMHASDTEAKEGAMLKTENELRDKQIASASGLVDARAGAGDIAAAARWSQMAMPGREETSAALGSKIDTLIAIARSATEKQDRERHGT